MKYKHLFFDLDHTLWDFDSNAKDTLEEVYAVFNLEQIGVVPFEDFYRLYKIHNDILWERYHKGFVTGEELKWKRMWRTLIEFKIANEPLAKQMSEKFLEILPTKKALFPHTIEVLEYLTEKNYQLHLITNGFEKTQNTKLNTSGLNKYFNQVVTSESSNSIKPHKEIFDYALNKAKAQLHHSIMLGDNLEADIQGAMNAGMDNIFVNHLHTTTTLKPTFTVTSLQQLTSIF
ncbi:MAG TPA: YjjG family noncanonical pyrimidine nucleotidase [Ferruginibacter sp.]|nr:YjjG family noncanonical pyrimidine nucleotidase [Ferruginibacter sp.]HMP20708.1 YjjG family noncanonical pyrimidine nucleotidase [Ferruginibacter sp.]